ncbi:hypothetical protein CORC01_08251, partial [Colletotrichum orchidophilum]
SPQLSFPAFCPSTSANGSTWAAKLALCESWLLRSPHRSFAFLGGSQAYDGANHIIPPTVTSGTPPTASFSKHQNIAASGPWPLNFAERKERKREKRPAKRRK